MARGFTASVTGSSGGEACSGSSLTARFWRCEHHLHQQRLTPALGQVERFAGGQQVHPLTGAEPGGWGWTDLSGAVPDADDTAAALLALAAVGGVASCGGDDKKSSPDAAGAAGAAGEQPDTPTGGTGARTSGGGTGGSSPATGGHGGR